MKPGEPLARVAMKPRAVQMKQGGKLPAKSRKVQADQKRRAGVRDQVIDPTRPCTLLELDPAHDCHGTPMTPHHVLKASRGGRYEAPNMVPLCAFGNTWVEDFPREAEALGLSVPSGPCAKSILLIDREESA